MFDLYEADVHLSLDLLEGAIERFGGPAAAAAHKRVLTS